MQSTGMDCSTSQNGKCRIVKWERNAAMDKRYRKNHSYEFENHCMWSLIYIIYIKIVWLIHYIKMDLLFGKHKFMIVDLIQLYLVIC